jgi:hypothetical protein
MMRCCCGGCHVDVVADPLPAWVHAMRTHRLTRPLLVEMSRLERQGPSPTHAHLATPASQTVTWQSHQATPPAAW